jgi:hypothetical protein
MSCEENFTYDETRGDCCRTNAPHGTLEYITGRLVFSFQITYRKSRIENIYNSCRKLCKMCSKYVKYGKPYRVNSYFFCVPKMPICYIGIARNVANTPECDV